MKKKIHFHLGADGVYENIFTSAAASVRKSLGDNSFFHLDSHEFETLLQKPIQAADKSSTDIALDGLFRRANTIAISRPKFLFSGSPLTAEGSFERGLYKLKFISEFSKSYEIDFHFFIVDHVAYLANHSKFLSSVSSGTFFPSWIPVIEAIKEVVGGESRLYVWNAEHPRELEEELCTVLGDDRSLDISEVKSGRAAKRSDGEAEEKVGSSGLDVELLDDLFEEDLDLIFGRGSGSDNRG